MSDGARMRCRIKGTRLYVTPPSANAAYEGASLKPRLVRWNPGNSGPNAALGGSFETLVSRSRDSTRKNPLAERGKEVLVSNIVGTGIKPNFKTPDPETNEACARAFTEWTDAADADGRFDFYGLQGLAAGSMVEGGDSFTRLRVRRPEDLMAVPLQLQVLESEFCPNAKNETLASLNVVRCGIEFDLIGRRDAYWLHRQHPNDYAFGLAGYDTEPVRVPASEVVHMARLRRPGQIRGEPWLARALVKLRDLDQYDDAQLVRQKIAALFAGFVYEETPDGADDEPGIFPGQTEANATGVALAALEPGTMQNLPSGKRVEFSKPPEPGNSYDVFMHQQELRIAASLNVLYEQLTGDYSKVNDRTWRAAVNEFRRGCEAIQHHIVVFQFCRPVMARWALLAVLSGRIRPPAGVTAETIAAGVEWLPPRWPYINPVQDVKAKKDEIRAGLTSRRREVAEDGYDVEDLDREIAADNARADELGLVFDSDPRRTSNAGLTQDASSTPGEPGDQEERAA